MNRIPSLDGLRAISIAAVLLGHLTGTAGFPAWVGTIAQSRYLDLAHLGVRVFFVISGFLITGLLMREQERTGRVNLRQFYIRRTLRILPAYTVFVIVVFALAAAGVVLIKSSDVIRTLTYTSNYSMSRSWPVAHLWSLAVEEQFYLLWPFTFVLLGQRRAGSAALIVLILAPLVRTVEATFFPRLMPIIGFSFETTADALATGCLLALWNDRLKVQPLFQRAIAAWWIAPVFLLLSVLAGIRYRPGLLVGDSLANVGVALLIARSVAYPRGAWGRFLNARVVAGVGTGSYSLYLWQQLFLNRYSDSWSTSFPVNLLLATICAYLSFRYIERADGGLRGVLDVWVGRTQRTVGTASVSEAP